MALRSFGGGALFAEVFGKGPPRVLALHGWGRRGRDFSLCLAGIPALAPDLPGFGASPAPSDPTGAEGYAEIISQMLEEFDRPPVLVGHSFGGRVAVCLAAGRPDEVGPIVLTGVPLLRHGAPKPSMAYRLLRGLHKIGLISGESMERIRRSRGSADYRAASGVMRDILVTVVNEGYQDQLGLLRSPVHMVWGAGDGEVPLATARTAGRLIERAGGTVSLEVVEGVGHNVPLEAPEVLRGVITSALE